MSTLPSVFTFPRGILPQWAKDAGLTLTKPILGINNVAAELRPNHIKHSLRQQGFTLKSWALAHGYKYRDVSDVVRGVRRGNYGVGRDICLALGIDPDERLAA